MKKKEKKQIALNKPFKSKQKYKKYSVYVLKDGKRRLIHFGDKPQQDHSEQFQVLQRIAQLP